MTTTSPCTCGHSRSQHLLRGETDTWGPCLGCQCSGFWPTTLPSFDDHEPTEGQTDVCPDGFMDIRIAVVVQENRHWAAAGADDRTAESAVKYLFNSAETDCQAVIVKVRVPLFEVIETVGMVE